MASCGEPKNLTTPVSPEHDPNNEHFTFPGDCTPNPKWCGAVLKFKSGDEHNLYSVLNADVWRDSGTAPDDSRSFGKIMDHLKKLYPDTSRKVSIMKFLAHVLRVDYHPDDIVQLSSFCDLVRWFGPFKEIIHNDKKTCVCLCNLEVLMVNSQVLVAKQKMSWFAGHMSSTVAADSLQGHGCGTYLIRFSESERSFGSFALSIVTESGDTEHVNIRGNPEMVNVEEGQGGANLFLQYCGDSDGCTYPNLPVLLNKRLTEEPFDKEHPDTTCKKACPNLPLNAIFKAYKNRS